MPKSKALEMTSLFRALADPTRLRLINLMGDQEVCVCFFIEVLGLSQPKISRHLAYLRRAGIVKTRRQGKWMHYGLVKPRDPKAAMVLEQVRCVLAEDKVLKAERQRLIHVCCSTKIPVQLQSAPRPAITGGRAGN